MSLCRTYWSYATENACGYVMVQIFIGATSEVRCRRALKRRTEHRRFSGGREGEDVGMP